MLKKGCEMQKDIFPLMSDLYVQIYLDYSYFFANIDIHPSNISDEFTYQSPGKDANNNKNNRFHEDYRSQSDKDKDRRRQNNDNNGTPKKSSFGSSLFSNSSKQITQNLLFVFTLLLLTLIKSSSLLILY